MPVQTQRRAQRWRAKLAQFSGEQSERRPGIHTLDEIDELARNLAQSHRVDERPGRNPLLAKLRQHAEILGYAYRIVSAAARRQQTTPAGEWLLDNFPLIEEQIHVARRHLPSKYSRQLPRLSSGSCTGLPRVYAIVAELLTHVDAKADEQNLGRTIAAYQSVSDLKLGELWAVPIMLRLALIEYLARIAARLAYQQQQRDLSIRWAKRLTAAANRGPTELLLTSATMAATMTELSCECAVELSRQLQLQNRSFTIALAWLDQRLAEQGLSREELIHQDSQSKAADQVSISNTIGSLRLLQTADWRKFVENASSVEQELRRDPAGVYSQMDFATRDRYRHVVEGLARRARFTEREVAQQAIGCAGDSPRHAPEYQRHVGYYLVDDGLPALERAVQATLTLDLGIRRIAARASLPLYVGAIAAFTLFVCWALAPGAARLPTYWSIPAIGGLALAVSQLAVALVNWIASKNVSPAQFPRLDLSDGIPAHLRSVAAIPALLTTKRSVDDLLAQLEIRFLGNRDEHLHFVLLTDFADAPAEHMPGDGELQSLSAAGIEALNQRYPRGEHSRFFLFHRPRKWNPGELRWMGFERKRGKLSALNRFLLDGSREEFSLIVGNTAVLANTRYIIVLDCDTRLPQGTARQLVGTAAHPLNQPVIAENDRVTRGYTILQPTVGVDLSSTQRSWYARLFSGEPGIDPYTRTISDVYQDLFGEGSFIGKGIYDIHAFERVLNSEFPENRILSHDLLEGCYVRCGLVSDVVLLENFPSAYMTDIARRQRWVRGDWQIARWLLPWVPVRNGVYVRNTLAMLSRWKIFDNLRRSLVPFGALLALCLSWALLPNAVSWTAVILLSIFFPLLTTAAGELMCHVAATTWPAHLGLAARKLARGLVRSLFSVASLPFEALVLLDAVVRTCYRLLISHRHLLEWRSATSTESHRDASLSRILAAMCPVGVVTVLVGAAVALWRPALVPLAFAILPLWFLSAFVAWAVSQPIAARRQRLSRADASFLRKVARRTWSYFERYAGAEDNWLPPDSYQEFPVERLAHRTSPTNIGIAVLSSLSAYDLGYVTLRQLLERTRETFSTLARMERFRGHFFNWYDTLTLKPLPPRYVSTVDSGNLAAHLLVMREGLLESYRAPLFHRQVLKGIEDAFALAFGALQSLRVSSSQALRVRPLLERPYADLSEFADGLAAMKNECAALAAEPAVKETPEAAEWLHKACEQIVAAEQHLHYFAPWLADPELLRKLRDSSLGSTWLTRLTSLELSLDKLASLRDSLGIEQGAKVLPMLAEQLQTAAERAKQTCAEASELAEQCRALAQMDFRFLFDTQRKLFSIGFNVTDHRLDSGYYDLFASEARLASYLAIAQGQVEQEHWFLLGRQVTAADGAPALISWSGSMFEYLMPLLVMPDYQNTLLHETYRGVVAHQIDYGRRRRVPWGVSESGYNITDAHANYQYRAFGVPGLGLKRGLGEELVVAPYATLLALMVKPAAATRNLKQLAAAGTLGQHGFYEAIDYSPVRLPRGATSALVRSYMAHHQGMGLLALDYVLADAPMQRRFLADPTFRSVELLLQERIPRSAATIFPHAVEMAELPAEERVEPSLRVVTDPNTPVPEIKLLSNGRYHVMVNAAGSGYSNWKHLSLLRWRPDAMCDQQGLFCYVRETNGKACWSTSFQPSLRRAKVYEAIFSKGLAEFRRSDFGVDIHTEIGVSTEDDVEVRRMTFVNQTWETRELELTSFGEVAINSHAADQAHPAFSKLFVETAFDPTLEALFCTRRPRQEQDHYPCLLHLLAVHGEQTGPPTFETDRAAFLGRGRSLDNPIALTREALGNSQGAVLDPIISIRRKIRLSPRGEVRVDLVCGVADDRQRAQGLARKYADAQVADRVFDLSWTHSQMLRRQLNASDADIQLFHRLAGSIVYPSYHRRASPLILAKNRRGQSGLWGFGISGDNPIVLLRIADPARVELVRQTVRAHAYWRMRGLAVDLLILNEDASTYRESLHDQILAIIGVTTEAQLVDKPGGIFVRRFNQIPEDDRTLLQTVARVILADTDGSFREQVDRQFSRELYPPRLQPSIVSRPGDGQEASPPRSTAHLLFFNGLGGFTRDGHEYVTVLRPGQTTPMPWVNVVANPHFGTVLSESGSAYTFLENSHEFRLTPWSNDPVCDLSGEAVYLRDEEDGQYWSPTPLPSRGRDEYVIRHGFGYSAYETSQNGIASEMTSFVAIDAPAKLVLLKLRNDSRRERQLSATFYCEWVLGELRSRSQMHVVTEIDRKTGAIFARNYYGGDFPERIAFLDTTELRRTVTCDRAEFLGRNGLHSAPLAMGRSHLSGRTGAGLDPCAAVQVRISLSPGQEREVLFVLGVGRDRDDAAALLGRFRSLAAAREALAAVRSYWTQTLAALSVETPEPAFDLLANGWLLYQTLSCRMWARTGFYQSGGAFGFRDQLQDSMALLHAQPGVSRQQLLRAAAHQFQEGDVQHWWHPPSGRGVRTHFADDYLWLPYATCHYVACCGDAGVLDERVPFLIGRPLKSEEESYYDLPLRTDESASLYEHCCRAIRCGLRFGPHGLPLMGCGDWNDGMNRVGIEGKGESVWAAFFLYDVLVKFEALARTRSDPAFADLCRFNAEKLSASVAEHAWDGQWYLRAFFDNGQPLGSSRNTECRLDSLPQSWSVLAEAGTRERQLSAMQAVNDQLVDREARLIMLLTPPFDKSTPDPGYIKGYVPGVRENGGQYTHAAIWAIMAFAALGQKERAWELLRSLNPIRHAQTPEDTSVYKVEPYVVAADVYAVAPHIGRGGWTWYTGSAGWMYRLLIETLLGITREGERLRVQPRIPRQWPGFSARYRYGKSVFVIAVKRGATPHITVDGRDQTEDSIRLVDDGAEHTVRIELAAD